MPIFPAYLLAGVEVIAKSRTQTKPYAARRRLALAAAMASGLLLCGCTGTLDLFSMDKVDATVKTNSVAPQGRDRVSDEVTVRNAVSSADLARNAGNPIPWANSASGSAGVISGIAEKRDAAGRLCRDFVTTRHSYQGIARFSGRTCATDGGEWLLLSFDRQG